MPFNPKIHHRRSIRLKGYDYKQSGLYFVTICCENRLCRFGMVKAGEMRLNEYGEIAYSRWSKLAERFGNFELDVFQIMPNHMHGIIVLNDPVGAPLAGVQNAENIENDNIGDGMWNNNIGDGMQDNNIGDGMQDNNIGDAMMDKEIGNAMMDENLADAMQDEKGAKDYEKGAGDYGKGAGDYGKGAKDYEKGAGASPARTSGFSSEFASGDGALGDIIGAYKSIVANECLKIYKSKGERMGKFWQRNYYENIIRNEKAYLRISEYIIDNPARWDRDKFFKH